MSRLPSVSPVASGDKALSEYEACCQGCGFTGVSLPIENASLIARAVGLFGFFNITCLDPCPGCGRKTEWTVYRLRPQQVSS